MMPEDRATTVEGDGTDPVGPPPEQNDWSVLEGFGFGRDKIKAMLSPLVVEIVADGMKELPSQIEQMVTARMDQAIARMVEEFKGRVNQAIGGVGGGTGATPPAEGVAGINPMLSQLLVGFAQKAGLIAGPAATTPGGAVPGGIADWAKSMNMVFESLVAPWMDVYNRGGFDTMKRLETMAKLGYDTPLGGAVVREAPPPTPVSMETPTGVAAHSQVDPAVELARRLRYGPK